MTSIHYYNCSCIIDPLDLDGQFCDKGSQYRSAVFYHNGEQKMLAELSKKRIEASGSLPGSIVTEIVPALAFYPAEEYHQEYYKKILFDINFTAGVVAVINGYPSFGKQIEFCHKR